MKIQLISPGKKHDSLLHDFICEYEKRLSPFYTIAWNFPTSGEKREEAEKILSLLKDDDYVVLLDETGETFATKNIAMLLEKTKNEGVKRLVIIIGGAYGVHEIVREKAKIIISLSPLVFPHMLVRAIIMEQLYRANSALSGGKYHHK
jgi:23S rRNA (pseudouridine1915-N3)-methyltransferase